MCQTISAFQRYSRLKLVIVYINILYSKFHFNKYFNIPMMPLSISHYDNTNRLSDQEIIKMRITKVQKYLLLVDLTWDAVSTFSQLQNKFEHVFEAYLK